VVHFLFHSVYTQFARRRAVQILWSLQCFEVLAIQILITFPMRSRAEMVLTFSNLPKVELFPFEEIVNLKPQILISFVGTPRFLPPNFLPVVFAINYFNLLFKFLFHPLF